jgi:hypothetical protein
VLVFALPNTEGAGAGAGADADASAGSDDVYAAGVAGIESDGAGV